MLVNPEGEVASSGPGCRLLGAPRAHNPGPQDRDEHPPHGCCGTTESAFWLLLSGCPSSTDCDCAPASRFALSSQCVGRSTRHVSVRRRRRGRRRGRCGARPSPWQRTGQYHSRFAQAFGFRDYMYKMRLVNGRPWLLIPCGAIS